MSEEKSTAVKAECRACKDMHITISHHLQGANGKCCSTALHSFCFGGARKEEMNFQFFFINLTMGPF